MRARALIVMTWSTAFLTPFAPLWSAELAAEPLTLSDILLPADALPKSCTPLEGIHAISGQARAQYLEDFAGQVTGAKPVARQFQSMRCGRKAGTVFYYQYATEGDADEAFSFIRTLVWGAKRPTSLHPELIERWKNIVVVVSFRRPRPIASFVMARLSGSSSARTTSSAGDN